MADSSLRDISTTPSQPLDNTLLIIPALAGAVPLLKAVGDDTNINIGIVPKGTGSVVIGSPLQLSGISTALTPSINDNSTKIATTAYYAGQAGTALPLIDGTAVTGTSLLFSRQDHVHPIDVSRAPLASPTFTGLVIIPALTVTGSTILSSAIASTPAINDNSTRIATTAYYVGQAGTALPLIDGTATTGTSLLFTRQDHVHPIDVSRAPIASPTFTGLLTSGNQQINGTLGVTGATTLAGMTASGAVNLTGTGTGLAVTNNTTIGGNLTVGGNTTLNGPLFVTKAFSFAAGTVSGPTNYAYGSNVSYSGTPTTPSTFQYHIFSSNDTVQFTPDSNTVNAYSVLRLNAGFTGNRIGLGSSVNVIGAPGAPTPGWVISLWGDITGTASQGGTGLTPGTSNGSIWAGLLNATLLPTATNYALYQGLEIDMNGQGTTMRKHGLQISLGPSDINRGALFDAAFVLGNNTGCAGSWKHGILLSEDSSQWPFASDSILIKAFMGQNDNVAPAVAAHGLDFLDPTFGISAFRTNGLSIDGTGNLQIGTGYLQPVAGGLTIDAKGAVGNTANGAGMIVTGGSGWNGHEVLTDSFGGRYKVSSVAAGVITALTVYRQPIFPTTTTPANPVTLGVRSGATGVPPTINISWNTTANALSLNPSGGATTIGGTLSASGTVSGAGFTALLAPFAPLASPTFTGTVTIPNLIITGSGLSLTPTINDNSTKIATTAYYAGQAGTATPLVAGTAAPGTSLLFTRQDHVHPIDTSRAPVASPTFTGTLTSGNQQVNGTLAVTGNATIGGTLAVAGTLTGATGAFAALSASGALTATGAGTGLAVTNNATVGGTLGVTGILSGTALTLSGTATVTGNVIGSTNLFLKTASATGLVRLSDSSNNPYVEADTSNAWVKIYKPMLFSASGVITNTAQPLMLENVNFSGTSTTGSATNLHLIQASTETITNAQGVNFYQLSHSFGGSTVTGPRNGVLIQQTLNAATGNTTNGTAFGPLGVYANMMANDNGVDLTATGSKGGLFSFNTVAHLGPSATFVRNMTGYELDVYAQAGSSVRNKYGMLIVQVVGDAVAGSSENTAFVMGNQFPAGSGTTGWTVGIGFGSLNSHWAFPPSATLINAAVAVGDVVTPSATNGIDWSNVAFSGFSLKMPGFTVDGSGNTTATSYKVGANQVVGARDTGWSAMTGTTNKATVYDTSTVTLAQLAGRVMALQAALTAHGAIGA